MLIQVARDPETREGVFTCNYNFISGAVTVNGSELIASEALYVFVAQVQHNWAIAGEDPVRAGIATFDAAEKALQLPSEDGDRAIAKGVVRVLMRVLQEQRFQNAAKCLRTGKYPDGLDNTSTLEKFKAATEYGLSRLLAKYWGPLLTGANTQDNSKVVVTDFLLPTLTPGADSYVWKEGPARYDFGPHQRMGMRFPHDDFSVFAVIDSKSVRVRNKRTGEERDEVDKH